MVYLYILYICLLICHTSQPNVLLRDHVAFWLAIFSGFDGEEKLGCPGRDGRARLIFCRFWRRVQRPCHIGGSDLEHQKMPKKSEVVDDPTWMCFEQEIPGKISGC